MSEVRLERKDGVVTLTLDRPQRRNAITVSLVEDAIAALEQIGRSHDDRAVVVTGAGGAFCSGMDLAAPIEPDSLTFMRRVGQFATLLHDLPRPTIAKVVGSAFGFGCNLAFCCDLVVASSTAVFGEVFAQRGLALDGGASWSLPRLVGLSRAKEILFFGAELSAQDAHSAGLVNRVLPVDEIDDFVTAWAQRLADGPTLALSMMKAALNNSFEASFHQAIGSEALSQAVALRTPEAKEAARAFTERRSPVFREA